MIDGVDLSHYQGAVDFAAVAAAGVQFVIIAAGDGDGEPVDPRLAENWQGAKAAGLTRGVYWFCRPELFSAPVDDAHLFLAALQTVTLEPGDFVCGDVETGSGDTGAWALRWLITVETALGFKPLCYTGPDYAQTHHFASYPGLGDYGLWIAHYGVAAPTIPAPWTFHAVWQHSDAGTCPGVQFAVDLDAANVADVAQLRKYGKPIPPKPAWDDAAQYQTIKYITGGSSPADLVQWVGQYV